MCVFSCMHISSCGDCEIQLLFAVVICLITDCTVVMPLVL